MLYEGLNNKEIEKLKNGAEKLEPVGVIIDCDGYYPVCGACYEWLNEQDISCPKCGRIINWRGLLDKKEKK